MKTYRYIGINKLTYLLQKLKSKLYTKTEADDTFIKKDEQATTTQYGLIKIDGDTTVLNEYGQLVVNAKGDDGESAYISVFKEGRISTVVAEDSLHGVTTVEIIDGRNGITPTITISAESTWVINGIDTHLPTKEKGDPGIGFQIAKKYDIIEEMLLDSESMQDSIMVICLEDNNLYIRLEDYTDEETPGWMPIGKIDASEIKGEKGNQGEPGITPTIDPTTHHWMLGDVDTEITAIGIDGIDGITPHVDEITKHWMIGNIDTGIMAEAKEFVSISIDATTNHWLIGGVDSGINATGSKGDKGDTGNDGMSPSATVTRTSGKAVISITDKNGTTTADVYDGYDDTEIKSQLSDIETDIDDLQSDILGKVDINQGIANSGKVLKVNASGNLEVSNDDVGTISHIMVNDEELTITNKTVSLTIPENISDLNNDSNFVSNTTIASNSSLGLIKVDGSTTTIDADGTLHSASATAAISPDTGNQIIQKPNGLYVSVTDLSNYLTESEIESNYAKSSDLVNYVEISDMPTKTSDLINDGSNGSSQYVELGDIPTTLSSFEDDITATTLKRGTVKPDGQTVTIDANGTITSLIGENSVSYKPRNLIQLLLNEDHEDDPDWDHTWQGIYVDADDMVNIATYDDEGKVKPDGNTIIFEDAEDEHNGTIVVNTEVIASKEYADDIMAIKQNIFQYSEMPESDIANKIVQYIGETDENFVNGLFYKMNIIDVEGDIKRGETWDYTNTTGETIVLTGWHVYTNGSSWFLTDVYINNVKQSVDHNAGLNVKAPFSFTLTNGSTIRVQCQSNAYAYLAFNLKKYENINVSSTDNLVTINQGVENQGKILKVNSEGNLEISDDINDAEIKHYSTEERMIGYWIDDKPIYRKVFPNILLPATTADGVTGTRFYPTNLSVDNIVSLVYITKCNTGDEKWQAVQYIFSGDNPNQGVRIYYCMKHPTDSALNQNLIIRNSKKAYSDAGMVVDVILEYTKTTD